MPIPQTAVPGVERPLPSRNRAVMDRARAHLLQNYKQQPIVLERGQGTKAWDADGNVYLDLLGGIATLPFGHCHPEITAAARAQLDRLWHSSNVFYTEPQITLAELLTSLSGLDRAFFCNSGAEANEALLKLARKAQHARGQPGRFEFVCFETSFHGRTLATVTATGQPRYQKGFEP
ncbi:MAG TPA: aminotransferase class III-fold pyridoxal phosphate-dependent enzyme, partial [Myxococcaceae bacterium]|nr:aminotransferase class III-fold pyridoxal phosphate-dependent enzyme [Myxococcaceae bacterium]